MKPETASVILEAAITFIKGIAPGAFGAAVAVAIDHTATWAERFIQFAVGIIVSYYVGAALVEWLDFGQMVNQGISFSLGMVAYNAVPKFVHSAAETAGAIPRDLWSWVKLKLGIKP